MPRPSKVIRHLNKIRKLCNIKFGHKPSQEISVNIQNDPPASSKSMSSEDNHSPKNTDFEALLGVETAGKITNESPVQKSKRGKTTYAKAFKIRLVPPPKPEERKKRKASDDAGIEVMQKRGRSQGSAKNPAKKASPKKASPKKASPKKASPKKTTSKQGRRGRPRKSTGNKPADEAAVESADGATEEPADETAKELTDEAAKEQTDQPSKELTDEPAEGLTEEPVQESLLGETTNVKKSIRHPRHLHKTEEEKLLSRQPPKPEKKKRKAIDEAGNKVKRNCGQAKSSGKKVSKEPSKRKTTTAEEPDEKAAEK